MYTMAGTQTILIIAVLTAAGLILIYAVWRVWIKWDNKKTYDQFLDKLTRQAKEQNKRRCNTTTQDRYMKFISDNQDLLAKMQKDLKEIEDNKTE